MLPCYHTVSDARRFLEKYGGRGRGRRENLWRVRDPMCRVICFQPVSVFVNSSKEDDLESAWENTIGGEAGRPVGMRMLPFHRNPHPPAFIPTEVFPTPDISACRIYLIFLPLSHYYIRTLFQMSAVEYCAIKRSIGWIIKLSPAPHIFADGHEMLVMLAVREKLRY